MHLVAPMPEDEQAALPSWGRHLERMPWPALEAAAQRPGSTVVWPFGAFEQHGPQLPMGTDALFADRVLDAVLKQLAPELPIWRSMGSQPLSQIGRDAASSAPNAFAPSKRSSTSRW